MKREKTEREPILKVEDLSVAFHMYDRGLEHYDLKVISNSVSYTHLGIKQNSLTARLPRWQTSLLC